MRPEPPDGTRTTFHHHNTDHSTFTSRKCFDTCLSWQINYLNFLGKWRDGPVTYKLWSTVGGRGTAECHRYQPQWCYRYIEVPSLPFAKTKGSSLGSC